MSVPSPGDVDAATWKQIVVELASRVPPGRATTYGLLAEAARTITGRGGPRQVGQLMAREGGGVAWWRVVRADGTLPDRLSERAGVHYGAEGTPRRPGGAVDLDHALWDPLTDGVEGITGA